MSYYILLFSIWILIPIVSTALADILLQKFFLQKKHLFHLFQLGRMHYGYPYYLSLIFSSIAMFSVTQWLVLRFLIFDFESKNFNRLVVAFTLMVAALLTEYVLDSLWGEGRWWRSGNYHAQKEFWENQYIIFLIPHLINAFVFYMNLLLFEKLSDLDPNVKKCKSILRKAHWNEEEFVCALKYRYQDFNLSEDWEKVKELLLLSKHPQNTFSYTDFRKTDKIFERNDTMI